MPERLWMATDKGGETYLYDRRPVPVRGEFLAKGDCWEVVFDDDNLPQPGEVWEYIRTDCIDTESGALAAATAEIDRDELLTLRRLLRGLWLSGLRLGEALRLTWDAGPLRLDLDHEYPCIRIAAGADKRGRASLLPITPDFARWIGRTPRDRRTGWVFPLPHSRRPSSERITRVISAIGAASHRGPGKHPTAHDLRRSFATRWAFRLPPLALQAILRHSSKQTTLGYYVDLSSTAADVAKLLAGQ